MTKILWAFLLFTLGQTLIWIQTNGQFLNKWAAAHPWFMSLVISGPTTYLFLMGTKYSAEYFGGLIWPGRFIGFGTGMIAFSILTYIFMGEGITTKTLISLILATTLVALQIFWK